MRTTTDDDPEGRSLPDAGMSAPATPGTWSAFQVATLSILRAVQLRDGARPRVEANGHKLLRVALLEVQAGAISWEVLHG